MIKVEVGEDKTSIEVVGKLSQILCETGFILKGIHEAVRLQNEKGGELYRQIITSEDFIRSVFHLLEVDEETTIHTDLKREELLKALMKEFMEE